jgi:GAF domain-containing protein/nitrogen-specific signal transduction histidine kinase
MFAGLVPGVGLLVIGSAFFLLVWVALRLLPGSQSIVPADEAIPPYFPEIDSNVDAVLIVQPGGRVEYVNALARQWFDLHDDEYIDLERLARRVRPSDHFLELCATAGQKRLTVNGKLVEATSYQIPGAYPMVLVAIRGMDLVPALESQEDSSRSILKVITDFSQSITSNLDQQTTLQAILENVSRIVPSDVLEVKVWDAEAQKLIPYRFVDPDSTFRQVTRSSQSQFGALTESLVAKRIPVIVNNSNLSSDVPGEVKAIHSYIGVPLLAGSELVGTLEAGHTGNGSFGQHDLNLLNLIAGQAGAAIRNSTLYEEEQRRAFELAGLANLTQAFAAIQDVQDLFTHLVESVAPLFDADIIGFLLYDDEKHTLQGQVPFRGLPPHIVEIYRASIPAAGDAERLIVSQQPILTLAASLDENWHTLGFTDIAIAASLRDSALVPLTSAGRMLGYFQVSHHRRGSSAFSPDELRLMHIVATQAAAIIDNALLMQQARSRALRSEALRRIASLSVSSATLDEILKFSMQELANLFQADMGAIFLLDDKHGELRLHRDSVWNVPDEIAASFAKINVDEPEFRLTVSGSQHPFLATRLSTDRRVASFYRPLAGSMQMESSIMVPLIVRDRSIGELMLGKRKADFYNAFDLQVVSTAAGQLASAVEGASLMNQTDESLRQQVDQLTSVTRIGRELNASLELNHIIRIIHDESVHATHAGCANILLFDPESGINFPRIMMAHGCSSEKADLSTLELRVVQFGEAIHLADFEAQGESPPHEAVRSALIVPIARHGRVLGLIHLHANQTAFFQEDAAETVKTIAAQSAIAIGNAQRYQDERLRAELMRRRADTLTRLSDVSYTLGIEQPLEQTLRSIAQGIKESTPFQVVLISLYEPETTLFRRVVSVGIPQEALNELLARKQPLAGIQQLLLPEFKIGHSFFIPFEDAPVVPSNVHMMTLEFRTVQQVETNGWHPDDILLTSLEDAQGNPLGLISLDAPSDGLRPDRATIESLDAFAAQAALAISSSFRFGELHNRIDALSAGLQRQQKLLNVTKNDVPILLRKDLEQTISLHSLERRTQRVRAGLAITESVSLQLDANSALMALGRETLTQLGMSVALIAENANEGPHLLHSLGSIPRSTNVEALFGQRNPLRTCLQTGEPILLSSIEEDAEWRDSPLLTSLRSKAVICLPVKVEGKTVAAMLALSPEPIPAFTDEDRQVYFQISRQTSVILQNISLLNETRRRLQEVDLLLDFSRRLMGLKPDEVMNALLDSAHRVLQLAHAGVAFLWNRQSEQLVPLAVSGYADNESMMRITYRSGEALPGITFAQKEPRRVNDVNFSRDYALPADDLSLYRQATGGRLPVSSILIPIVAGNQALGLLILDNFNTTGAFNAADEALLLSLAQQVSLSLENVRLVHDTQERAGQLQALNEVAASLTSNLRSDQLIASLLDQFAPVLAFDTATLLLRDKDRLKVAAARGFADTEQRLGLSVAVADSALFNEINGHGQAIVIADVREDSRFPRTDSPRLSWLGIPLISKGELIGVITLEKDQPHFFTRELVQVATTFASQAAVAIENARLYEESLSRAAELDQRSQRLALLNRFSTLLSGLLDSDQVLQLTAHELLQALGVKRISVVTFERGQALWKVASPKPRYKLPKALPDAPIFARLRDSLGMFNTDDAKREPDLAPLLEMIGEATTALLIMPLVGGNNQLRALVFAHASDDFHFKVNEIELARTITSQAAISLENARLYQSTVNTAERFAILNETSSQVSASLDPEQIYVAVHKAAERLMPLDSFTITLLDQEKNEINPVYLVDFGKRSESEGMRIPLGRGLSSQVIQSGRPLLFSNLEQINRSDTIATQDDATQSIVAVPMILGGKTLGMLSAQSIQPNVYSEEDMQILGTLANQAIVAIQNGRLFAETQSLAAHLEARVVERTAQLQREQQNTETLLRILVEVSSSLDLDRALNRTLSLLNESINAEQGTIMLVNAEDNMLHYRAGFGYLSEMEDDQVRSGFALKIGEGLAGWVVQHREPVLVNDLHEDSRWVRAKTSTGQEHRSAMATPMLVGEDAIGVLMVFHRAPGFFSAEMLNLVKAIASQVAVAINNAHLYELIRDQAERLGVMLRKEQEDASRSQAILEAVADGVLVTGANNMITFANASTQRILNLEAERLLGQPLEVFGGLFGKAASEWMQTIRRWSEDTDTYKVGDMYAEQLELENGRIVLVHLAPVIFQNDFLGTVSIFRDITHEVEVDRLKSEFVATVSHELRTPMTAIKGYVDILVMGAAGAISENQAHFLHIVKNNIERLNILVNDLLDISRIEAGRVVLSLQPLDLREVAEDIIADVLRRSREDEKPMALSLDAPKNLPRVVGDVERVRQIMANLVYNAYHYTSENGTIRVNIHPLNGNEVQVDVVDNGVGVAVEDQGRIFERFFRGENALVLATPGTGLGLSIVRQLVEMHSGKIWMTSKGVPGEGSTFSFTLPAFKSE